MYQKFDNMVSFHVKTQYSKDFINDIKQKVQGICPRIFSDFLSAWNLLKSKVMSQKFGYMVSFGVKTGYGKDFIVEFD